MENTALKDLQELLVGATVLAVEPAPEGEESDCLAVFKVERGGKQSSFQLHATELGSWVNSRRTLQGDRALWDDADKMLENIREYLSMVDGVDLVAVGDPLKRAMGFRCTKTGREWWTGMTAVKKARQRENFLTPESRQTWANEAVADWGWKRPEPGAEEEDFPENFLED